MSHFQILVRKFTNATDRGQPWTIPLVVRPRSPRRWPPSTTSGGACTWPRGHGTCPGICPTWGMRSKHLTYSILIPATAEHFTLHNSTNTYVTAAPSTTLQARRKPKAGRCTQASCQAMVSASHRPAHGMYTMDRTVSGRVLRGPGSWSLGIKAMHPSSKRGGHPPIRSTDGYPTRSLRGGHPHRPPPQASAHELPRNHGKVLPMVPIAEEDFLHGGQPPLLDVAGAINIQDWGQAGRLGRTPAAAVN